MDGSSNRPPPRGAAAAMIIGQMVEAGREAEFEAWINEAHASAARFQGCLGTESKPPAGINEEWTSVYSFDSAAHLQTWMNSPERGELDARLAESGIRAETPTQQVIVGETTGESELVAVVVSHRIPPGKEDAFQAWQARMTEAEQHHKGFRGAELFKPVPGFQDEWTAVYRFESGDALEAWLSSAERRRLLEEGKEFEDYSLRTIQNSFGSWFEDGTGAKGPGDFKTSIAVWVGLYPTVMLLSLAIAEIAPGAKLWQTLLVGNLLSSLIMTYVSMPRYANPLLRFWLTDESDPPDRKAAARGLGLSLALIAFWAVVFWLTTTVIWTLP